MNPILEGFQLIRLTRTDSTNNFAAKLQEAGSVSGPAAILAEFQTAGRGQRGAQWESEAGANLTCSLLPGGTWPARASFALNMRAAVSICQAIEPFVHHARVQIKWPNDILINRQKVAGILVENQLAGDTVEQSIIGIGLNLNQLTFSAPGATSLGTFSGQRHCPKDLLHDILYHWNRWEDQLEELQRAFMQRLLGTDAAEPYEAAGERFQARIHAISPEGVLTLCEPKGDCREFREKEVRWLGGQN